LFIFPSQALAGTRASLAAVVKFPAAITFKVDRPLASMISIPGVVLCDLAHVLLDHAHAFTITAASSPAPQ